MVVEATADFSNTVITVDRLGGGSGGGGGTDMFEAVDLVETVNNPI